MLVRLLQRGICWEAELQRDTAALHVALLKRLILFQDLFGVFGPSILLW